MPLLCSLFSSAMTIMKETEESYDYIKGLERDEVWRIFVIAVMMVRTYNDSNL